MRAATVAVMSTIGLAGGRSLLIEDAAIVLGVSRRTIYYRIREGRLETLRTRGGSQRVLLSSIERLLHEGRQISGSNDRASDPAGLEPEALTFQVEALARDAE